MASLTVRSVLVAVCRPALLLSLALSAADPQLSCGRTRLETAITSESVSQPHSHSAQPAKGLLRASNGSKASWCATGRRWKATRATRPAERHAALDSLGGDEDNGMHGPAQQSCSRQPSRGALSNPSTAVVTFHANRSYTADNDTQRHHHTHASRYHSNRAHFHHSSAHRIQRYPHTLPLLTPASFHLCGVHLFSPLIPLVPSYPSSFLPSSHPSPCRPPLSPPFCR